MATGPWRQAHAPPFLLPRPAGFCYADGGGRLSQRRRGCWGRRRPRRGGRKVQLSRPASPSNVTLCKRQNPGAPELTRARTADAPVASSLFSARQRKPAQLWFAEDLSSARLPAQLRAKLGGEPSAGKTFLLRCLPSLRRPIYPIPRLELRFLPTLPLGGFTRTAPRSPGRVIGLGIHVSALRTAPRAFRMASLQQGEKQLFEKFWKGTFKAVATPRPESIIVASITARKPLPR